jgi:GxxExxY protein
MQNTGIADRVQREYGDLTYRVVGAAMAVHRVLGPGFPEKLYQQALAIELTEQGVGFERERPVEVFYGEAKLGDFYLDFLVEDSIVLELKAVEELTSQHQHQVISYLTASGREVGLLINFGGSSLEHKRILPPLAVQRSDAYQLRRKAWRQQTRRSFAKSAKSA